MIWIYTKKNLPISIGIYCVFEIKKKNIYNFIIILIMINRIWIESNQLSLN
jgi:hypothetical protein